MNPNEKEDEGMASTHREKLSKRNQQIMVKERRKKGDFCRVGKDIVARHSSLTSSGTCVGHVGGVAVLSGAGIRNRSLIAKDVSFFNAYERQSIKDDIWSSHCLLGAYVVYIFAKQC